MFIYLQAIENEDDREKFVLIYRQYARLMYKVAFDLLKNEQDAEDAVHLAFVSIIENLDKIAEPVSSDAKFYCTTVCRHKAIDMLRHRDRLPVDYLDDAACNSESGLILNSDLSRAIDALPERYRDIILLRYAQGYSVKEISEIWGISKDAAQKTLWRAKSALADALIAGGVTYE